MWTTHVYIECRDEPKNMMRLRNENDHMDKCDGNPLEENCVSVLEK